MLASTSLWACYTADLAALSHRQEHNKITVSEWQLAQCRKDKKCKERNTDKDRQKEREGSNQCMNIPFTALEQHSSAFKPSATWSGNEITTADALFFNFSLFPLQSFVLSRLTLIQFQPCWGHSLHGYVYWCLRWYTHTNLYTISHTLLVARMHLCVIWMQQLVCNCISEVHLAAAVVDWMSKVGLIHIPIPAHLPLKCMWTHRHPHIQSPNTRNQPHIFNGHF